MGLSVLGFSARGKGFNIWIWETFGFRARGSRKVQGLGLRPGLWVCGLNLKGQGSGLFKV